MTEEEMIVLRAEVRIANAKADAAVRLVTALANRMAANDMLPESFEDFARDFRDYAFEHGEAADRYAAMAIFGASPFSAEPEDGIGLRSEAEIPPEYFSAVVQEERDMLGHEKTARSDP